MLRKTLLLTIAAMFALSTTLAVAAPPPWAGGGDGPPGQSKKGKGYGKQKKNKHRGGGARASGGPPPWAPAHGYRRKQGGTATGGYKVPFDIGKGTCNRTEIGAVIGGVAGGVLGSRVAKGDSRLAGTLIGTIAGAVIGGYIGRSLDRADDACMGQVMEHADSGRHVSWTNPDTRARYDITPQQGFRRDDGRYCRNYTIGVVKGGTGRTDKGLACRRSNGIWDIIR